MKTILFILTAGLLLSVQAFAAAAEKPNIVVTPYEWMSRIRAGRLSFPTQDRRSHEW